MEAASSVEMQAPLESSTPLFSKYGRLDRYTDWTQACLSFFDDQLFKIFQKTLRTLLLYQVKPKRFSNRATIATQEGYGEIMNLLQPLNSRYWHDHERLEMSPLKKTQEDFLVFCDFKLSQAFIPVYTLYGNMKKKYTIDLIKMLLSMFYHLQKMLQSTFDVESSKIFWETELREIQENFPLLAEHLAAAYIGPEHLYEVQGNQIVSSNSVMKIETPEKKGLAQVSFWKDDTCSFALSRLADTAKNGMITRYINEHIIKISFFAEKLSSLFNQFCGEAARLIRATRGNFISNTVLPASNIFSAEIQRVIQCFYDLMDDLKPFAHNPKISRAYTRLIPHDGRLHSTTFDQEFTTYRVSQQEQVSALNSFVENKLKANQHGMLAALVEYKRRVDSQLIEAENSCYAILRQFSPFGENFFKAKVNPGAIRALSGDEIFRYPIWGIRLWADCFGLNNFILSKTDFLFGPGIVGGDISKLMISFRDLDPNEYLRNQIYQENMTITRYCDLAQANIVKFIRNESTKFTKEQINGFVIGLKVIINLTQVLFIHDMFVYHMPDIVLDHMETSELQSHKRQITPNRNEEFADFMERSFFQQHVTGELIRPTDDVATLKSWKHIPKSISKTQRSILMRERIRQTRMDRLREYLNEHPQYREIHEIFYSWQILELLHDPMPDFSPNPTRLPTHAIAQIEEEQAPIIIDLFNFMDGEIVVNVLFHFLGLLNRQAGKFIHDIAFGEIDYLFPNLMQIQEISAVSAQASVNLMKEPRNISDGTHRRLYIIINHDNVHFTLLAIFRNNNNRLAGIYADSMSGEVPEQIIAFCKINDIRPLQFLVRNYQSPNSCAIQVWRNVEILAHATDEFFTIDHLWRGITSEGLDKNSEGARLRNNLYQAFIRLPAETQKEVAPGGIMRGQDLVNALAVDGIRF